VKAKDGPIIVQADATILLDDRHKDAEAARELVAPFADLMKRPGHMHTYRMTSLSLWNAAASGMKHEEITAVLNRFSRYELPLVVLEKIRLTMGRYGQLNMELTEDGLLLLTGEEQVLVAVMQIPALQAMLQKESGTGRLIVDPLRRGVLKQELAHYGYPIIDVAGYRTGEALQVQLRDELTDCRAFQLRDYQRQAVDIFYNGKEKDGGSGVLVLPCGAGKTVIGIAALARLECDTLILTSNVTSVRQWKQELMDKTTLEETSIGEYAGTTKQVRPVTIATYQILTSRRQKSDEYAHMKLFSERNWGLIIYDEVHLLPAPVFRMTADLQATRRLGLTATLVREDGRETDVFSLIGPKRFDLPWKVLEQRQWIAAVDCLEIRVPLEIADRERMAGAKTREKIRIAAENNGKLGVVRHLLHEHKGKQVLVIGQYLQQLHQAAAELDAPLLTGELTHPAREELYQAFKRGDIPVLVVSKVANFAVDLPDAAVAIQLSGSYGSRQEEAQRIGRILRPKPDRNQAWFYTLVTEESKETDYARKRQLFLLEQGYRYGIKRWQQARSKPGQIISLELDQHEEATLS